ncbi:MAG: hypothetical protein H0U44_07325 [Flavisolibacter sp.]|nr:hypothetical protein [Flavisolibacter sp.]
MRTLSICFIMVLSLVACNNQDQASSTVDSIDQRKDTLLDNIDSTAQAQIDSLKKWSEKQAAKVDSATEARKDSVKSN